MSEIGGGSGQLDEGCFLLPSTTLFSLFKLLHSILTK